jgi:dsDNA-specific endonuclease/ATPase MutS2
MPEQESVFKPKFKAEFTMWGLDYERLDGLLNEAHELAIDVKSGKRDFLVRWKNVVEEIYKFLHPLLYETAKRKFDSEIKAMKATTDMNKIIEKLDDLHTKLLDIRQIVGLGIPVTREEGSLKRKISKVLGG